MRAHVQRIRQVIDDSRRNYHEHDVLHWAIITNTISMTKRWNGKFQLIRSIISIHLVVLSVHCIKGSRNRAITKVQASNNFSSTNSAINKKKKER